MHSDPQTKGRGAFTNINSDVKYLANDTTHQFSLSVRGQLIVQSAQHSLAGFGVIILNKGNSTTNSLFKLFVVKALKEETSLITKYFRFKDKHIGNGCSDNVHI